MLCSKRAKADRILAYKITQPVCFFEEFSYFYSCSPTENAHNLEANFNRYESQLEKRYVFFDLQTFSRDQEAGHLKGQAWSRKAEGVLNETKVSFRKKGVFSNKAEITDPETGETLGQIEMSGWRNKARITLGGKTLNWRFTNIWNTRRELLEEGNSIIKYKSRTFSGEAELQIQDGLMMLTGLFIFNHFTQIMLTVVTVSTIIIAAGN